MEGCESCKGCEGKEAAATNFSLLAGAKHSQTSLGGGVPGPESLSGRVPSSFPTFINFTAYGHCHHGQSSSHVLTSAL